MQLCALGLPQPPIKAPPVHPHLSLLDPGLNNI